MSRWRIEAGDVPGWTFDVEEVSAGAFKVRGVDQAGRSVEATGSDPDALLADCKRYAADLMAGGGGGRGR